MIPQEVGDKTNGDKYEIKKCNFRNEKREEKLDLKLNPHENKILFLKINLHKTFQ